MGQIFHRSTNTLSRVSIFGGVILLAALVSALAAINRSPYVTAVGVARVQPVPFSHKHHVADDGIDCRYCHTSVERSSYAGIPPTKTCMNCHSQIWTNAAMLEPVRESYRTGQSLMWTKVNYLPDYVYFNHSIHINKGVGCASCHGPVNNMPYMYQESSMRMEWCLNCHRAPEKFLRPRDQVVNMNYQEPSSTHPVTVASKQYTDQIELGTALKAQYKVRTVQDITGCSTCHR